jgi:spoIIIJ-associated protein
MASLEMSGRTVEEAIQNALKELGVSREEVRVSVLKKGKTGVLGLGAEEALVRVELVSEPAKEGEVAEVARSVLEALLAAMGLEVSVVPGEGPPVAGGEEAAAPVAFDISGDDLGILIGRRGQTLSCLQYLVRLIVGRRTGSWAPIMIDVEGYKQRRYKALQALALRIAEQVQAGQMPFTLEPMSAYERRIVHLALAEHPDVTTQSVGEGEARKVVILPREN